MLPYLAFLPKMETTDQNGSSSLPDCTASFVRRPELLRKSTDVEHLWLLGTAEAESFLAPVSLI
jgi:hypothetical protein